MSMRRLGLSLPLAAMAAASPPASADYSVRGVASVNAGAGACQDADIANAMPLPSVTTTASCVAPSGASASGQTIADLTTGSVGLALLASPLPDSSTNAAAQAQFSDRLVFSVPGGIGQNDDLLVDVTFTLTGTISPATLPSSVHALNYSFEFYDFSDPLSDSHNNNVSGSLDPPFAGTQSFTKTVALRGAFLTANVSILLDAPDIHAGDIDFLHTATVTIDAPPGVSFVSDSGVFLSAPEVAGSPLGVASLLALGGIRRRRFRVGRRR
jgi:hypothetical protein